MIRTYSELMELDSFKDRFEYLALHGSVFEETFGHDRYLNQLFYKSKEYKDIRRDIIVRDTGCDLGCIDHPIQVSMTDKSKIYIHHMNPVTIDDLYKRSDFLLNPEYLICTSYATHQAIHYGCYADICSDLIERTPNDTAPWRNAHV